MSHCRLWYHLILVTRGRQRWLDKSMEEELVACLRDIALTEGAKLCAAGGWREHLHLLVQCPGKIALSDLVASLKAISSRWIHERFPHLKEFAWEAGYPAFSVSHSQVPAVRAYIDAQEKHHTKNGFRGEYLRFLEAHDLEEQYQAEQERRDRFARQRKVAG